MLLADFIQKYNLNETEVYTQLHEIKNNNIDQYMNFVSQNEFNELCLTDEAERYLVDILVQSKIKHNIDTEDVIEIFKLELDKSEKRYNALFEEYLNLSKQLQLSNQKLMAITENQQKILVEQIKAVEARDPRHLAKMITELEDQEIERKLRKEEEEEEFFQIRYRNQK